MAMAANNLGEGTRSNCEEEEAGEDPIGEELGAADKLDGELGAADELGGELGVTDELGGELVVADELGRELATGEWRRSWVPDNGKTRLKHTKCPLYILPSCLLTLCKPRLLLCSWSRNCIHKSSPRRIDTIGEVISFGVGVAVDLKVNRRRISLGQSCEHSTAVH
jgi:hypothetical protein